MDFSDLIQIQPLIYEFEQKGVVTRTFRRLDPERQKGIILAILDEAIQSGPQSINIKNVANRAGVSVGSLYQYFGSRGKLVSFSTTLSVRLLTDGFQSFKPFLADMPLQDALSLYLIGGLEWSKTMQGLVQYFGRAAYSGDPELSENVIRPVAEVMRETVMEMLLKAQERGELRADMNVNAAAHALNAWIIALADSQLLPYLNSYFQVTDETTSFEIIVQVMLDILEHGIYKEKMLLDKDKTTGDYEQNP